MDRYIRSDAADYALEIVDPVSREADYSRSPKADLILITHSHSDHLDKQAIDKIRKRTPESSAGWIEVFWRPVAEPIVSA